MRVALITPGFSAGETDDCIPVLLGLVRRLAVEHQVTVFTLRYPHTTVPYRIGQAEVIPLGGHEVAGLGRLGLLRRAYAVLAGRHRRQRFEVIHAFWADEPGFLAALFGRRTGVPSVVSLFGGELVGYEDIGYGAQLSRLSRWLIASALAQADVITSAASTMDELARPWIQRRPKEPRPRRLVMGVDLERFALAPPRPPWSNPSQRGGGDRRTAELLHVANLVPVKDQRTLLRALALVGDHGHRPRLTVIGDGPLGPSLRRLAEELRIGEQVRFLGALPHDQLAARYAACDLCVLSSRHESQCLVILEAAASGRLTVGTRVGQLPDLVPGRLLARPGDPYELAAVLRAALDSPSTTLELAARVAARVRQEHGLARTVSALSTIYSAVRR